MVNSFAMVGRLSLVRRVLFTFSNLKSLPFCDEQKLECSFVIIFRVPFPFGKESNYHLFFSLHLKGQSHEHFFNNKLELTLTFITPQHRI